MSLWSKIAAAMFSFSTLGLFNSSIGAVLPLISEHYSLTDLHVSLLFLAGPVGYILGAQGSDPVHQHAGQRGVAIVGPVFQVIATAVIAAHPTFGLILAAFAVQGLGTGLLDGSWCAWAGSMQKANTISGLLHGSYSVGGAAGPMIVAVLISHERSWWLWYSILVSTFSALLCFEWTLIYTHQAGICVLEFIALVFAFRNDDAEAYQNSKQSLTGDNKADTKAMFRSKATWLCALFFIAYVGTETAISGWVVSFMLRNRNAGAYLANLASSGFWIGMAIGRLTLGFVTDAIGVRRATLLYFSLAIIIEVLFATLSAPYISVVLMTILGFVMGPFFPSGVVVLTRLLPKELHVAAVSFVASLGQVGGAFLPFAIGAVVQSLGIGVFRYAILLQTIVALGAWTAFARLRTNADTANDHGPGERRHLA